MIWIWWPNDSEMLSAFLVLCVKKTQTPVTIGYPSKKTRNLRDIVVADISFWKQNEVFSIPCKVILENPRWPCSVDTPLYIFLITYILTHLSSYCQYTTVFICSEITRLYLNTKFESSAVQSNTKDHLRCQGYNRANYDEALQRHTLGVPDK